MTTVRQIPLNIDRDQLRALIGRQGSKLNPVKDALGVWIISEEEWTSSEFTFQDLSDEQKDLWAQIPWQAPPDRGHEVKRTN